MFERRVGSCDTLLCDTFKYSNVEKKRGDADYVAAMLSLGFFI